MLGVRVQKNVHVTLASQHISVLGHKLRLHAEKRALPLVLSDWVRQTLFARGARQVRCGISDLERHDLGAASEALALRRKGPKHLERLHIIPSSLPDSK